MPLPCISKILKYVYPYARLCSEVLYAMLDLGFGGRKCVLALERDTESGALAVPAESGWVSETDIEAAWPDVQLEFGEDGIRCVQKVGIYAASERALDETNK